MLCRLTANTGRLKHLQNNQPSPNITKSSIISSKGAIYTDHPVLQKSYLGKKMDRRVSIFKQNKHAGKLNIVMTFLVIIYRYRRFQKRIQISENKIQTNKNAQACGSCDGCFSVSAEDDW